MRLTAKICCIILLLGITAHAEIEKIALPCDAGLCLFWWPKLPPLQGWHQDKDMSFKYQVNALAPDGSSFAKADAVLYANANYKPRMPETKTLEQFLAGDQKDFLAAIPGITIKEVGKLPTGDGKILRSFTFFPKSAGNWEQVSYGEEGEFYLVFTLSAHSNEAFLKAQNAYRELISHYKEKP
jgi:hypothetical protein